MPHLFPRIFILKNRVSVGKNRGINNIIVWNISKSDSMNSIMLIDVEYNYFTYSRDKLINAK